MALAAQTNSTFVLRRNSDVNCLPNRQTVRTYYAGTLAVPLAIFEACAILLASGRQRQNEGGSMDSAYASWVGLPVVLRVALGDIKVPLRGKMLKDGGETVRMRIDGWDIDIYKTMILAVEEDAMTLLSA
jgi:hypothetical protein